MHNYPLHRAVRTACCNLSIPKIGRKKSDSCWHPRVSQFQSPKQMWHVTQRHKPSCKIETVSLPQVTLNPEHDVKRKAQKHSKLKFLPHLERSFINILFFCTMQTISIQTFLAAGAKQKDVSTKKRQATGSD